MATVWLATDLKHHRPVAVKVMNPEVAADLGPQRFLSEIEIAARLSHPNILPLFDSGRAGDLLYYVMPYVPGETLRGRIAREKRLPIDDALRIARELAAALSAAHAQGVVHRDVKPENVLLSDGFARLADFGIARAAAGDPGETAYRTTAGAFVGTPAYLAPEQAGGGEVDARTDLYALACVLYELLVGQPPFVGATEDVIRAHLVTVPRPVIELRPDVPRAVSDAVARALAKSKADRFPGTDAFAGALRVDAAHVPPARSIAVLPFLNLASDPENEYFADGITEDVIAQLAKVRALKVISRTSVMPFKKRDESLREIGARLDVATLLDGSVRKIGNRVRIVAQLVDAATDESLWAETYDRELTDIFAIQSDVALRIAAALKAELSPTERARIQQLPTDNIEAYELYLRGRELRIRYKAPDMLRSIELFEQAIALDPKFALAYVDLATVRTELCEIGAVTREEARAPAIAAADRALELDPNLAGAHTVRAFAALIFDFDWARAEAGFKRAIEHGPNHADAYDLYGRMCAGLGRFDEALELQRKSQELDPIAHRVDLATTLLRAERFDEALEATSRALQRDPYDPRIRATHGWALFKKGRIDEGLAELERAVDLSPTESLWRGQLGQAYGLAGRTDQARRVLAFLESPAFAANTAPYHLAYVYTGLGDLDRAMACVERAIEQRPAAAYAIRGSFLLAPLRAHPKFPELLRRIHLA